MALTEAYKVEGPAILWRGIGSLAVVTLANTTMMPPYLEDFLNQEYQTWQEAWYDEEDNGYILKVRQADGEGGPASLFILEPEANGTSMYTRYVFSADPNTQDNFGYLAVFKGLIDRNDPNVVQVQAEQMNTQMILGTAHATIQDAGKLFMHLSTGVIEVASWHLNE